MHGLVVTALPRAHWVPACLLPAGTSQGHVRPDCHAPAASSGGTGCRSRLPAGHAPALAQLWPKKSFAPQRQVLLLLTAQVYYGMNLLQQFIIRRIGASLFAMCTALRLVASIAGAPCRLATCVPVYYRYFFCPDRKTCQLPTTSKREPSCSASSTCMQHMQGPNLQTMLHVCAVGAVACRMACPSMQEVFEHVVLQVPGCSWASASTIGRSGRAAQLSPWPSQATLSTSTLPPPAPRRPLMQRPSRRPTATSPTRCCSRSRMRSLCRAAGGRARSAARCLFWRACAA